MDRRPTAPGPIARRSPDGTQAAGGSPARAGDRERKGKDKGDKRASKPLEDILHRALEGTNGNDTSVEDLLEAFGHHALGPVVLLCGLLTIIPVIGMLPGAWAVIGAVVVLFSVQYIVGKPHIWLPRQVRDISIERDKLKKAQNKFGKWLARLDRLFTERLTFMTGPVMNRVTASLVTLLGLSMFILGLVPAGIAIPGWALIFFGVGLTARDGLFLLLAYATTAGAVILLATQFPF